MQEIKMIWFPNTVWDTDKTRYEKKNWCSIIRIEKNWEMARVWWFQIFKDWIKIAEIKESICDIYF